MSGTMLRRDTNFYYAFLVLPPEKRCAIVAVWDFFRAVDDAVDEAGDADTPEARAEVRERIALWRRELAACYEGGPPATPQGVALAPFVQRFALPREQFAAVIDGVEMDVGRRRWRTFADLREYCQRVASAVGLVCIEVFGYEDPACRQYATNLGIALQLTNILRDIGKDYRLGRLYLPQEDFLRFGVSEKDVEHGRMTDGMRALLAFEISRAREYYKAAEQALPTVDIPRMAAARAMGAIYHALLTRIERQPHAVFGEPIRLPRWQKAAVALKAWVSAEMGL